MEQSSIQRRACGTFLETILEQQQMMGRSVRSHLILISYIFRFDLRRCTTCSMSNEYCIDSYIHKICWPIRNGLPTMTSDIDVFRFDLRGCTPCSMSLDPHLHRSFWPTKRSSNYNKFSPTLASVGHTNSPVKTCQVVLTECSPSSVRVVAIPPLLSTPADRHTPISSVVP
jgi:hypothetical protein